MLASGRRFGITRKLPSAWQLSRWRSSWRRPGTCPGSTTRRRTTGSRPPLTWPSRSGAGRSSSPRGSRAPRARSGTLGPRRTSALTCWCTQRGTLFSSCGTTRWPGSPRALTPSTIMSLGTRPWTWRPWWPRGSGSSAGGTTSWTLLGGAGGRSRSPSNP